MSARPMIAACAMSLAAVVGSPGAPASGASEPVVTISRVQYYSPGDDTGSNASLNKEWIRLTSQNSSAQMITGWTIRDPEGHVFKFPEFKLRAGKSVTVHTGAGADTKTDLYWDFDGYVWNNTGDKAVLKDADRVKVDSCQWGDGAGSIAC